MPENTIFSTTAERILRILPKLYTGTSQMLFAYQYGHQKEANDMASEYELLAEKLTICYRQLPSYTGSPNSRLTVEQNMAEAISVEIGFTQEGWFVLRIPRLLPRKERGKGSADYIRGFLYPAMQRFFQTEIPVRFDNCVIIYRHIYDRNEPARRQRDHDNIEVNFVTDTVALFVMTDDAPLRCQHHYCSAPGTQERTDGYGVPESDFTSWYEAAKHFPDEGVTLHAQTTILPEKDVPKQG